MKLGIYFGQYHPSMGGGFTFQESLLMALRAAPPPHEVLCFYYGQNDPPAGDSLRWVRLAERYDPRQTGRPLHSALSAHPVELVWFVTPDYETIEVPCIYTVWDLQHRTQPWFPEVSVAGWTWESRERFYQQVLPRAAYVISGTQAGKDEVVRYYAVPEHRVRILAMPTPEFALRAGTNQPQPDRSGERSTTLFYPAQFWPHKNHIALLLALRILREEDGLDFSVVLTGSDHGNQKYIQETVAALDLTRHVAFRGFIPRPELVQLYRTAFALVYPSFFGPDNIPPLEAFALGCPVIAANSPGASEQLGEAALLFNPADERDLATSIRRLHDDPGLRGTLIKRGLARAQSRTAQDYLSDIFRIADEFQPIRRCWTNREPYQGI